MNYSQRARYSRQRQCCSGGRSSEVGCFCSRRLLASRRQPVPPGLAFGSVTRTLSWHCVKCLAPTLLLGRGGRSLPSSPSYRETEYSSSILVTSKLWRTLFLKGTYYALLILNNPPLSFLSSTFCLGGTGEWFWRMHWREFCLLHFFLHFFLSLFFFYHTFVLFWLRDEQKLFVFFFFSSTIFVHSVL